MRQLALLVVGLALFVSSCEGDKEHLAGAVNGSDTVAFMRSCGINSLISDSGLLRYKLVAEEWDIYTNTQPYTWKFMKGLLMQRFNETFQIDLYVQSDTAYLHQQRTWELRGRVLVKNVEGTIFKTEELFWDMQEHEMWNHAFMHIITPERELEGTDFRSNEQMTEYYVSNSVGNFPFSDTANNGQDDASALADTVPADELMTPTGQKVDKVMPSAPDKYKNVEQRNK